MAATETRRRDRAVRLLESCFANDDERSRRTVFAHAFGDISPGPPFLLIDRGRSVMVYHTLPAYSIQFTALTEAIAKKLPRYRLLPATLMRRLAIGRQFLPRPEPRTIPVDGRPSRKLEEYIGGVRGHRGGSSGRDFAGILSSP